MIYNVFKAKRKTQEIQIKRNYKLRASLIAAKPGAVYLAGVGHESSVRVTKNGIQALNHICQLKLIGYRWFIRKAGLNLI
jgi:hypothetical protein